MRVASLRRRVAVLVAVLLLASCWVNSGATVSTTPLSVRPSAGHDDIQGARSRGGGTTYRLANAVVRVGVTVGDAAMGGMT